MMSMHASGSTWPAAASLGHAAQVHATLSRGPRLAGHSR